MRDIVIFISVFSVYFPFISGVLVGKYQNRQLALLTLFYGLSSVSETWSYYLAYNEQNNLYLSHFFVILEFVAYSIFMAWSSEIRGYKTVLYIGAPVFVIYALYNAFLVTGLDKNNTYPITVQSLWMILWSGLIILNEFSKDDFEVKKITPSIQIVGTIFIYFLGSFFVQMSYVLLVKKNVFELWFLHPVVNTATNILFGLSILKWKSLIQK